MKTGAIVVALCILAGIPWRVALSHDGWVPVAIAMAPPLAFAVALALRHGRGGGQNRPIGA